MFERFHKKTPPPAPPDIPKWTPVPRKRREYQPPKRYQPPERNIVYGSMRFDDGRPSAEKRLMDMLIKGIKTRSYKEQPGNDEWY